MMKGNASGALIVLAAAIAAIPPAPSAEGDELPARRRRPSALVATADGFLYVANRASGTISVLDSAADPPRVLAEVPAGGGLADLAATPDGRFLLAADAPGDRVVLLERRGDRPSIRATLALPSSPAEVRVAADGRLAVVASLW